MKIEDILEQKEESSGPLWVANRDFQLVPNSEYKGYVMGDSSIDDDDGFVKIGYSVYKFAKTTEHEWNGKKYKQDHYRYIRGLVDPRTKSDPSPYGRLGKFSEKDLDLFMIKDQKQRQDKLDKPISYDDMFRYTVDALENGSLQPQVIPHVSESVQTTDLEALKDRFGKDIARELGNQKSNSVLFTKDKDGRNWKIIKDASGKIKIERDYMLEGDVLMLEGRTKALVGTILGINEDAILIEGGIFPMIGPEDPPGEMETDLTDMPHRDEMLAISAEIWHLLQEVPDEYDTEDELNYLDDEARKLGYEPVIGIDPYPFLDINWHHKETDRYFKITPKYLKQDQRFRGTINESDAAKAITQAFGGMAAGVKKGLIRRAGLLAMQGRHSEAESTIRHLLKDLDAAVADKIRKSINDVKPVKVGDEVADTSAIEKSKAHTDWLDKTFVPWMEKLLGKKLDEAKYKGREVKLGKPMAGDVKKYKVYVRDPKTGNVKKVNFGDKGMEIKRDDPARRRNFRKRHGCGTPRASNRLKAAYWSCRMWSSKPVSKILKGK